MCNLFLRRGLLVFAGFASIASSASPQIGQPVTADRLGPASGLLQKQGASSSIIAVPEDFATLKLAPGFQLEIEVYDVAELSGTYRIDAEGNIQFPLLGSLRLAGLTRYEVSAMLEKELLLKEVLKHPQVRTDILQYMPDIVNVTGEVQQQGRLELLAPHDLLDILAKVGGVTSMAGNKVIVTRDRGNGKTVETYVFHHNGENTDLASVMIGKGDSVTVPRAGIVYILGAVNRPGGYLLQEDGKLNVAQAFSVALGTTLQAKVTDIRILRPQPDATFKTIHLSYKKIVDGKETPPLLYAEDILYVPVSHFKAALTGGTSVLSAATSATIYTLK
jgi:polysaccharide export outer membrane protein